MARATMMHLVPIYGNDVIIDVDLRHGAFRNKSSPDWHSGPVVPLKSLKNTKAIIC